MKIKKAFVSLCVLCFFSAAVAAQSIKSVVLYYDEAEEGVGVQSMRYLINDDFIRIDNGNPEADFILFDVNKNTIFSINHEDQTVLKIKSNPWTAPTFDFKFSVHQEELSKAPKIYNKPVHNYQLKAGDNTCTQVFMIKDVYPQAMKVMYAYQQVLSGQQVATLKNTPAELHTPCFLLDQVYHSGDYYLQGLPVQITYSRGYAKLLKDFKEQDVEANLFKLPEAYREYRPFTE